MPDNTLLLERLQTYAGHYECHITVDIGINNSEHLQCFEETCKSLGAKAIVIQLSNGKSPNQPMLSQFIRGDLEHAVEMINTLHNRLAEQFTVVRLKVEAAINNSNIPQSDAIAEALPKSCYFEHHIKMRLAKETDLSTLKTKLAQYHGYLSKNAHSFVDGQNNEEYRFVTQRFRCGEPTAKRKLDALEAFLQNQPIAIHKIIREFNIFDSYSDLDNGWMI
ncbi:MAG: hypothetical protein KAH22_08325 [Thiotrichaceae bacterium]|nr:hypothetical protein [Thiotrichaceae bacterium]